ncbi:MAG TPA: DUF4097 family beta strand repeat-containing protein [Terriglobales bacterium]|nr:DUF4097 family beta strand repeat-containing protein [Terriglobales bacterium]
MLVATAATCALAQDQNSDQTRNFHWAGKLSPDQIVEIKNLNGKIEARGDSSIDQVEVTAEKSGRDADEVKIDVIPNAEGVTICAIYPHGATGPCEPGDKWHVDSHNEKARVDFIVRIPMNIRFAATSINGGVTAENMGRFVRANSVNGSVHVSTKQWAEVSSVNGSIEANMGSADWTGTLKISTVNGSINLRMPSELNADVRFSSVNGRLESDFPLTMSGKFGGRRVEGRIGSGGRELVVDTVNGSLRLKSESI